MKNIDNLIRDNNLTALIKSTKDYILKEGSEVNRIYDRLKRGKLDLLIPESFGDYNSSDGLNYTPPTQKNITLSFEHCRPSIKKQKKVSDNKSMLDVSPDILTMHKIKVPIGYVPTKVILQYQVYTEIYDAVKINFKVGTKSIHIIPNQDGVKKIIGEPNHNNKDYTFIDGNLEINLKDNIPNEDHAAYYLNENNEIPFSIFIHESKHHALQILIGCERQESACKNWKRNTYNQFKEEYKIKREKYERQFNEQLKKFSESEVNITPTPNSLTKKVVL